MQLLTRSEQGNRSVSRPQKDEPDVDESGASESKVTPLVRADDETSDETSDDHDKVKEDQGDDVREGQSGGEDQLEQEAGGGDDPVDVPHVPELTGKADIVELDQDGSGTEVRGHGEVGLRGANGIVVSANRDSGTSRASHLLTIAAVVKMKILRWWNVLRPLGKEKHHPIMRRSTNNMAAKMAQRKLDAL